ncbi:hypothetical protein H5410_051421 [Solanum commersonii]|uniref:Uncharacterized protein n=1 Tax=Solanum commersonii TaxID=4109 RepID=A0A9J5WYD5_SOLCO|nr:hypothetical protein H5410_051421 [Solanum commersonii]
MEILPSPLSPKYRFQLDSIYENFVGNLAVISETRGEASFEWGSIEETVRREKIDASEVGARRGRLSVGYGFLS